MDSTSINNSFFRSCVDSLRDLEARAAQAKHIVPRAFELDFRSEVGMLLFVIQKRSVENDESLMDRTLPVFSTILKETNDPEIIIMLILFEDPRVAKV